MGQLSLTGYAQSSVPGELSYYFHEISASDLVVLTGFILEGKNPVFSTWGSVIEFLFAERFFVI